ncbi:hypothetical protein [Calycomorphotria hydatis]|uniref:Glycosyltransferase RgtA/B/C/D-like domain-containing protein n=1 Tax=Calycomorphotria hydatis TaxID=2528027 RepID=A0A517T4X9_9PLAN|nr:hypothetical protein [Calycomorphotria hydatis]QDT63418.1 hypothetical protein V22_06390 [Calycomorphotria hydatis]
MFFLGIVSLLQALVLPGLLLLRLLNVPVTFAQRCVFVFAFSQILNHLLVRGLVSVGSLTREVLAGVIIAEVVALAVLFRKELRQPLDNILDYFAAQATNIWRQCRMPVDDPAERIRRRTFAFAIFAAAFGTLDYATNFGLPFTGWDAVLSWNRWAIGWADNSLPATMWEYPQLLPTNWAVSYVLIDDINVWVFARAQTVFYPIAILWLLVDLAFVTKRVGIACAVPLTYAIVHLALGKGMSTSGYADVPVGFFTLAAVVAIWLARESTTSSARWKLLCCGALFAAGAALTKQAGLFIAVLYPFFALLASPSQVTQTWRSRFAPIGSTAAIILLLVLPWYLATLGRIHEGSDTSILNSVLVEAHHGRTIPERILNGFYLFGERLSPLFAIVVVGLFLLGSRDRFLRWFAIGYVLPYSIFWLCGFSYDLRNFTPALLLIALITGIGMEDAAKYISQKTGDSLHLWLRRLPGYQSYPLGAYILLAVGVCLFVSQRFTTDAFNRHQVGHQRVIGHHKVNDAVFDHVPPTTDANTILSDYDVLRYLPSYQQAFRRVSYDLNDFQSAYSSPETEFVVFFLKYAPPSIKDFLAAECAAGRCQLLQESDASQIYQRIPSPVPTQIASSHNRSGS